MSDQTIFNWALSALSATLGFLLHTLWGAVAELRRDLHRLDKEQATAIGTLAAMQTQLDRIENSVHEIWQHINPRAK